MLFEVDLEGFADSDVDSPHHFVVPELCLGLSLELRLCDLDAHDSSQAFTEVVPRDLDLHLVQELGVGSVLLQRTGQPTTEARQVRTALDGVDVVDVAVDILVVGGIVGHRHLYGDALLLSDDMDDVIDEVLLGAVDVLDEFLQTFLRIVRLDKRLTSLIALALIDEGEGDTGVEEG